MQRPCCTWSSNPLLVTKPEGSVRMCIDYRPLSHFSRPDAYPMPRADDIASDKLADARFFSVIDFKSGFHQIPVQVIKWQMSPGDGLELGGSQT